MSIETASDVRKALSLLVGCLEAARVHPGIESGVIEDWGLAVKIGSEALKAMDCPNSEYTEDWHTGETLRVPKTMLEQLCGFLLRCFSPECPVALGEAKMAQMLGVDLLTANEIYLKWKKEEDWIGYWIDECSSVGL